MPITCSVSGTPITGCNIDLWSVSGPCANTAGANNAVCLNPAQGVPDGPANGWFAPCAGAAYTYPNDNDANDGDTGSGAVSCCIGTEAQGCAAPARQGKGLKRDLGETVAAVATVKRNESEGEGEGEGVMHDGHSHLARHLLWRRARSHSVARRLEDVV